MRKRKKIIIALVLAFASMILSATIMTATTNDLNIISTTTVNPVAAQKWAKEHNASETFIELAPIYWELSKDHANINPAIAYAQAAVETNYGKFTGNVSVDYKNPCGMRTSDSKDYAKFDSWYFGISAQLDHLALYAGANGYPRTTTYDTRHFKYLFGTAKTVEDMGAKWSASDTYSDSIIRMVSEMEKYVKDDVCNITSNKTLSNTNTKFTCTYSSQNNFNKIELLVNDKVQKVFDKINPSQDDKGMYNYKLDTNIDITNLNPGDIKIVIRVYYVVGFTKENNLTLQIDKPEVLPIRAAIDAPTSSLVSDDGSKLHIRGWALAQDGVKDIKVYIDDKLMTTIKTGISRSDVVRAFSKYNDSNAGYDVTVPLTGYKTERKIKLIVTSNNGDSDYFTRTAKFENLGHYTHIDTPKSGTTYSSSSTSRVAVNGWALSDKEVAKVEYYIGSALIGRATYGTSRPDVKRAFPKFNNENVGYTGYINMNRIPRGTQTIIVRITNKDGSHFDDKRNITVNKKVNMMCIDAPSGYEKTDGKTLKYRGWALNDSGVLEAKMYIDDTYVGKATYETARDDVNRVYPGYPSQDNAGFDGTIDITKIGDGTHEFKVVVIGWDGSSTTATKMFTKGNVTNNKKVMLDPGHGGADSGALGTHNGKTYRESDCNLAISLKIAASLRSKGYQVSLTRTGDYAVDLYQRSVIANKQKPDIFISIHQDSFTNTAYGCTTYYTSKIPDVGTWNDVTGGKNYKITQSQKLGNEVMKRLPSALPTMSRGVRDQSLSVTRNSNMPSVLIECGFITSDLDYGKLVYSSGQQRIANAISDAVDAYFGK